MALNKQFKVKNDFNTGGRILSAGVDIADIFAASNTAFTLSATNSTALVAGGNTASFLGGNGVDVRLISSTKTVVASGTNATSSTRGVASFSIDNFSVTDGAVIIKDGGINNNELAGSINDTKLLQLSSIGKVANSATTATTSNDANTIVSRGASGEFSSGSITAAGALSASGNVTGNIINAATGFKVNNGAAAGLVLVGNGSNFVPTTLLASNIGSGQALTTSTNNNVSITLGGAPTVALLSATSLDITWNGQLSVARGGTGTDNGSISGTGEMTFAAGGSNQNIILRPSGSGSTRITNANISSGLTVAGNSTFSGTVSSSGVIDSGIGFRVGGTATSGQFLRGNGTNFVPAPLSASEISNGATLTGVNDPNITLTFSGSPTTALLNATTVTVAFSGILPVTRGGTGSNNGSITGSTALTFTAGGSNQDINLNPSGSGEVNITKVDIDSGTIDNVSIGSTTPATIVNVDNLRLDSNVISSLNSANISLQPATGTTTATGNLSASQTVTGNIINGVTGFKVNNAATSGQVLRGDGTNFVSAALSAADITSGRTLTGVNDPNITLTFSGSPSTALLNATTVTVAFSGILPVTRGGTGSNNGSITGTSALTFAAGGSNQDINLNPSGSGEVNISKVDINGGTIDGTTIGLTSPASGVFTGITVSGDVNINGSLYVTGSATQIDTTNLVVSDPLIFLAEGNLGDNVDIGFTAAYNHGLTPPRHTGLVRNNIGGEWTLFSNLSSEILSAVQIPFDNPSIVIDTLNANIRGNVTGTLSGTANKANQFTTGRTISLSGDVSYTSPTFDGTQNVSGTATISNSAVNSDKILNGAVTTIKIADGAVIDSKIALNTIDLNKLKSISNFTILGNKNIGGVSEQVCTQAGFNLLDDASVDAQRTTLGLGASDVVTFGGVDVTNGSRAVFRRVYSGSNTGTTQTLSLFPDVSGNTAKINLQIKQGTGASAKRCALETLFTRVSGSTTTALWDGTVYAIVDPWSIFQEIDLTVSPTTSAVQLVLNYIGSANYTATASVELISD